MYQKLMTKEILDKIPPLYGQEKVADPIVYVKFFCPWNQWTWYATEYRPSEKLFFGWVKGHEEELGYFSLDELESVNGPFGLKIERDMHFDPKPLSWVKSGKEYGKWGPLHEALAKKSVTRKPRRRTSSRKTASGMKGIS